MKLRYLLFLTASLLLFISCGKQEGASGDESLAPHSTWTDSNPEAFWDKQPDGLRLDTVWMGDTAINF